MFAKKYLLFAALCGAGLISNALALEPASAPVNAFQPGEEVVAAVAGAPLMRGYSTLATAAQGQTLRVLKVEGPWVGTTVTVNGTTIGGWIWSRQLMTRPQYQAMRETSRRRYSYQPSPVYEPAYEGYYGGGRSYSGPFMGVSPSGPSWRADRKVIGY